MARDGALAVLSSAPGVRECESPSQEEKASFPPPLTSQCLPGRSPPPQVYPQVSEGRQPPVMRLPSPLRHGVLGGERSPSIYPHSGRCRFHPDLVNRPPKPHRSSHPQALQGGPTWSLPVHALRLASRKAATHTGRAAIPPRAREVGGRSHARKRVGKWRGRTRHRGQYLLFSPGNRS